MSCTACNKKASELYVDKPLCKSCYTSLIEKRVRKYLRLQKKLKKGMKVLALEPVTAYFIERIVTMPIELVKAEGKIDSKKIKEQVKKENPDLIIIPWTLDDEDEEFLSEMFWEEDTKKTDSRMVKLFTEISSADIKRFCEIRKIRFDEREDTDLGMMLRKLEEKYPGTKRSVLKTSEEIRRIISEKNSPSSRK